MSRPAQRRAAAAQKRQPVGKMINDDDIYCLHCGGDDLACGELYASGREWTCRRCGNVFQRDSEGEQQ